MTRLLDDTIVRLIARSEAGASVPELCEEFGVSRATLFRIRARYARQVDQLSRLRRLEQERLEAARLATRREREVGILSALLRSALPTIEARDEAARLMKRRYGLSERRACQLVGIHRSTARYRAERRAAGARTEGQLEREG